MQLCMQINANSKADEAGARVGDVVVAVNGTETKGLTQFNIMKLIQRSGEKLVLRIERYETILFGPIFMMN